MPAWGKTNGREKEVRKQSEKRDEKSSLKQKSCAEGPYHRKEEDR